MNRVKGSFDVDKSGSEEFFVTKILAYFSYKGRKAVHSAETPTEAKKIDKLIFFEVAIEAVFLRYTLQAYMELRLKLKGGTK